jgi:hypothetical protein
MESAPMLLQNDVDVGYVIPLTAPRPRDDDRPDFPNKRYRAGSPPTAVPQRPTPSNPLSRELVVYSRYQSAPFCFNAPSSLSTVSQRRTPSDPLSQEMVVYSRYQNVCFFPESVASPVSQPKTLLLYEQMCAESTESDLLLLAPPKTPPTPYAESTKPDLFLVPPIAPLPKTLLLYEQMCAESTKPDLLLLAPPKTPPTPYAESTKPDLFLVPPIAPLPKTLLLYEQMCTESTKPDPPTPPVAPLAPPVAPLAPPVAPLAPPVAPLAPPVAPLARDGADRQSVSVQVFGEDDSSSSDCESDGTAPSSPASDSASGEDDDTKISREPSTTGEEIEDPASDFVETHKTDFVKWAEDKPTDVVRTYIQSLVDGTINVRCGLQHCCAPGVHTNSNEICLGWTQLANQEGCCYQKLTNPSDYVKVLNGCLVVKNAILEPNQATLTPKRQTLNPKP